MANKKRRLSGHKANNWKMWNFFIFYYYCDSKIHGIENADIALISICMSRT